MKKKEWHNKYRLEANLKVKYVCEKCKKQSHNVLQIHHLSYQNISGQSIYMFSFEVLYNKGLLMVLCRKCHLKLHIMEEKNVQRCEFCGIHTGIERAKQFGISKPICKKCFRSKLDKSKFNKISNSQINLFE